MRNLYFFNVKPTNADLKKILRNTYYLSKDGVTLGYTKDDSTTLTIKGKVVATGVEQISAMVARADFVGWNDIKITTTLMSTNPDFVMGELWGDAFEFVAGDANGDAYYMGDPEIDIDLICGEIDMVPTKNAAGVKSNSFRFWKMYADPTQGISLIGSKNNFQEMQMTLIAMPDETQGQNARYGIAGNVLAGNTQPLSMMIVSIPKGLPTILDGEYSSGIKLYNTIQKDSIAVLGDRSATNYCLVNNVAGAGTDETIEYDGMVGAINIGDYVQLGTGPNPDDYEIGYVYGKNATELSVYRGMLGTKSRVANHADDTTIAVIENLRRVRVTQQATWASSDAAKATVGNDATVAGVAGQKGRITATGTAGATNITATWNGTASDNFAVTNA
jgi:hypothetical protein